jgi:acetolactate synthase-1/2/3 large subunit
MICSGADKLLSCLEDLGADTIFGYPGGAVLPIYDALVNYPDIRHILTRHEQGAVHAADAYARAKSCVGVCMATSGPGATNIMTGLANALMDSIPMVAITGQVPSHLVGTDAFQEIDTFGLSIPVTKHSYFIERTEDIPEIVREAFWLAQEGRPGPVLIDFPKDLLIKKVEFSDEKIVCRQDIRVLFEGQEEEIQEAVKLIKEAKRPVMYVGGGAKRAPEEIRALAKKLDIPVTTTLMALGTVSPDDPLFMGMPGMHGTERANMALYESDLILAVGTRFDDRVTGAVKLFAPHSKKIQIDNDAFEFDKNTSIDVRLMGCAQFVLEELLKQVSKGEQKDWKSHLSDYSNSPPLEGAYPDSKVSPESFFQHLKEILPKDSYVVTDVGQHQMWCAQYLDYHFPGSLITSGGLGTMGYGVPAALGAKLAQPDKVVVAICGDGGFQMTCQELTTIVKHKVACKIIILDNACLGMVRQWQELFHGERYSEVDLSDNPDFVKLAEVYRVPASRLNRNDEIEKSLKDFLFSEGPSLLHVLITEHQNVYPIVPPGAAPQEMVHKAEELQK